MSEAPWAVRPDEPDAAALLRGYFTEIVARYHGRPVRPSEVTAAMAESPSADLIHPTGCLLVAHHRGEPAGCVGLRWRPDWAELTRMYVVAEHRGRGGGAALLAAAQRRRRSPASTGYGWTPATTWWGPARSTRGTATWRSPRTTTTCTPRTGSRSGWELTRRARRAKYRRGS